MLLLADENLDNDILRGLRRRRATMPAFAFERIARAESMPGLVVIAQRIATGRAIEELMLLDAASLPGEWEGRVLFLPFV